MPTTYSVPITVASYAKTNRNTFYQMTGTGNSSFAQSFLVGTTCQLDTMQFFFANNGSTSTAKVCAKLYNITGSSGINATPTGAAVATSASIDVSAYPVSFTLQSFTFSAGTILTAGNYYAAALEFDGTSTGSLNILVGVDSTTPTDPGNLAHLTGGFWSNEVEDMIFGVNGLAPNGGSMLAMFL